MRYKIYGQYANGYEDCMEIEANTIEEIIMIARSEADKRGWTNCWSEEI